MSAFNRPPRRRLSERQKTLVRGIVGIGMILLGVLFLTTQTIAYAPGDYRGSEAYRVVAGGLSSGAGLVVLLSIRFARLRRWSGPRRK